MEDCILRALRSTAPPLPPCPSVAPCNVQRPGRRNRSRSPLGPAPARTVLTPTRDIVADDADEPTANPPLVARDGHQRWLVAAIGVTDAALADHTPPLPSAILFRDTHATRQSGTLAFSLQPKARDDDSFWPHLAGLKREKPSSIVHTGVSPFAVGRLARTRILAWSVLARGILKNARLTSDSSRKGTVYYYSGMRQHAYWLPMPSLGLSMWAWGTAIRLIVHPSQFRSRTGLASSNYARGLPPRFFECGRVQSRMHQISLSANIPCNS